MTPAPDRRRYPSGWFDRREERPADGFRAVRDVTHVTPSGTRLTDYEAVIGQVQPDFGQFEVGEWSPLSRTGRGVFDPSTTALAHPDWFEYRDPSGLWQRTYVREQAAAEQMIERCVEAAHRNGSLAEVDPAWARSVLAPYYEGFACAEWGMFLAYARAMREALSDTLTMTLTFAALDRLRHQQAIALAGLDFDQTMPGYVEGLGKTAWLTDAVYQPARVVVEQLMACEDWAETAFVIAFLVDPLFTAMVMSRFFRRAAPLHGDVVTPVIVTTWERDRDRTLDAAGALVRMVTAETDRRGQPVPAEQNRRVLQGWVERWSPEVLRAVDAFAPVFCVPRIPVAGGFTGARAAVVTDCDRYLGRFGLRLPVSC